MTDIAQPMPRRTRTTSGEWCNPTAEISGGQLASLLTRARRPSSPDRALVVPIAAASDEVIELGAAERKASPCEPPTDAAPEPLFDPWFQDSQPVAVAVPAADDQPAVIHARLPVDVTIDPIVAPETAAAALALGATAVRVATRPRAATDPVVGEWSRIAARPRMALRRLVRDPVYPIHPSARRRRWPWLLVLALLAGAGYAAAARLAG